MPCKGDSSVPSSRIGSGVSVPSSLNKSGGTRRKSIVVFCSLVSQIYSGVVVATGRRVTLALLFHCVHGGVLGIDMRRTGRVVRAHIVIEMVGQTIGHFLQMAFHRSPC